MELVSTHICKVSETAAPGTLFGGVMMAWLDEAGAAFALQACETTRIVTKLITDVNFVVPVRLGDIIKIYCGVNRIGTSSITVDVKARRYSVNSADQKTVCRTTIVFVNIDADGNAAPPSRQDQG